MEGFGQAMLSLETVTAAIIAVLGFFALRLYPIWNNRFQGCDAYNILLCAESLRQTKRLPICLPPVYLLEEQEQWYPPGFLILCALLPPEWLKRNYWLLNHLVDLIQVAIVFGVAAAISQPIVGVLAVLTYGMMPALIQEYAALNTRPLGTALQSGFLIAVYFSPVHPGAVLAAAALGVLLFYSHKLSLQQLWFTLPLLAVMTGEWKWLGWLGGSYLVSALVWPRGFLRILQGHMAIVRFWNRFWPLLGAHAVRQSPIYGDGTTRTDFYADREGSPALAFAKESLHQNYFAVPALSVALLKSPLAPSDIFLLGWIASAYVAAILIHHLPVLRAIGLGRQYIKFGIVPSLLLLVLNADLASVAFLLLTATAVLLEIRQYTMVARNMRRPQSGQVGRVSTELDRLLDILRATPYCRVICLPTHLCDLVAYRARVPTYWGTHSHCFDEKLADFFPVLRRSLAEYAQADGLTHLLIDRNYASATELGLAERHLLRRSGEFELYQIDSLASKRVDDGIVVANFMDSSLEDLATKGVFSSVADTYNPSGSYRRVIHFTPHERDLGRTAELAESAIRLVHHPAAGLSPLKMVAALRLVVRTLREERADIVRGRLPYLGSLIGAIAARILGIPFVVSLGGDNRIVQERNQSYYYGSRFISYVMESMVLRMADAIIVPNNFTQDYVASIVGSVLAETKCRRVPWISEPIPPNVAPLPLTLGIPDTVTIIPIIGFLNRYKFTDVIYDAIDIFLETTENLGAVEFIFCGDGPLREVGENRFAGQPGVRFLGWQDRKTVQALLTKAEAVLIPMSGFVLLEAASIGKPVITSAVEWHSEIVRDNETGLIVDPHDAAAWVRCIRFVLDNPSKATELGAALHRLYWAEYSPSNCIAAEVALYQQLTRKRAVA